MDSMAILSMDISFYTGTILWPLLNKHTYTCIYIYTYAYISIHIRVYIDWIQVLLKLEPCTLHQLGLPPNNKYPFYKRAYILGLDLLFGGWGCLVSKGAGIRILSGFLSFLSQRENCTPFFGVLLLGPYTEV